MDADVSVAPITVSPTTLALASAPTVTNSIPFLSDMRPTGTPDTTYVRAPIQCVLPIGAQFLVNTTTANDQTEPSVAMDENGDFTIAWQGEGAGLSFSNDIEAQRFDRDGNRLGSEFMVNTSDSTLVNFAPYVGMAPDCTFAVTWSQTDDPNYILDSDFTSTVQLAAYNADGTVALSDRWVSGGGYSSVAFDSGDDLAVSWTQVGKNDNITGEGLALGDIFAQEYQVYASPGEPSGQIIRPAFRVSSANLDSTQPNYWPFSQQDSQVAMDANGDLTASYDGFGPDVSNSNTAQRAANDLVQSIAYTQEQLVFTYQPVSYTVGSTATAGNAVGPGYFRLYLPNVNTTANILFDPTSTATLNTVAGAIQTQLRSLTGMSALTVTYQYTNAAATSYWFLVKFNSSTAINASTWPCSQLSTANNNQATIPASLSATFQGLNNATLSLCGRKGRTTMGWSTARPTAAMFSQFPADPRLKGQAGAVPYPLTSDDVANATRDGQDTTYYLQLNPAAVSGGFTLTVVVPDGVYPPGPVAPRLRLRPWRLRRSSCRTMAALIPTRPWGPSTTP